LYRQLAVLKLGSETIFTLEDVRSPSPDLKIIAPQLFLRLQLACLTHRFCLLIQPGRLEPLELADKIDQLYVDVCAWRDSLQAGYQPGNDVHADTRESQLVLLLHLEYHGLVLAMFTALEMTARALPRNISIKRHSSLQIRNHATIRTNNARMLLNTVRAIVDKGRIWPQVVCWYDTLISVELSSPTIRYEPLF
jgi:hypothetical protein